MKFIRTIINLFFLRRACDWFVVCILFLSFQTSAQYSLKIQVADSSFQKQFQKTLNYKTNFTDSLSRNKVLFVVQQKLFERGYLAASFDSMVFKDSALTAILFTGEVYKWAKLSKGMLDEGMLTEAGLSEKSFRNKIFTAKSFTALQKQIIKWFENHGYPFATVKLDSVQFMNDGIYATMQLTKNNRIVIDSIIVKGNARIGLDYLLSYLSIKKGDLYNESTIRSISVRLKELPMVTETKPFAVEFSRDRAIITLFIDDRKASQADGVLGILPNEQKGGKVNVTGEIRLRLISPFGRGEQVELNWKQPAPKTQDLKTRINYPFLLSTPFGIELGLNIYKKDTTYVDVFKQATVQYLLQGGNYFKAYVSTKNSSLLSTNSLTNATVLPSYADVKTTTYGLGYKSEKLDYRLNPRRGYSFDIAAGTGNKKIAKNSKLKDELYKNIDLTSAQYNGDYTVDFYFPLASKIVLNVGSKGAYLSAKEIFQNELFRFGGLKSLRGFDEESIYANEFYMLKTELRYLLDRNSFLQIFFNGAYYKSKTRDGVLYDTPYGFGAGITFETKIGIFSLNYALGKQFNNPILFRAAKVHFGIVNYF